MKVLDHGQLDLLDVMGDDLEPARAAKASLGKYNQEYEWEDVKRLTTFLWKNQHTSPFEMVELKFYVKCPIFVARQWLRHRTANVNEISWRYAHNNVEFYTPQDMRGPHDKNKQSSVVDKSLNVFLPDYIESVLKGIDTYEYLIKAGVANEVARMVLPQNIYTSFIWKNDLHNTLKFLGLRAAEDAQWEIRQYSEAMVELMKERLPMLMEVCWND